MPWDETKAYIRSGHRDPDLFLRIRTITLSEEQGIKALIGPLKSDPDGPTLIQSYLFSKKEGWTMPKAKAWFRKHESPSLKFMRKLLFPRIRAKIKGRRLLGGSELTPTEREELPRSDFACPDRAPGPGSYPINDPTRVASAKAYYRREDTVKCKNGKLRICRRAKKFGMLKKDYSGSADWREWCKDVL